jgi:hypothetical protein
MNHHEPSSTIIHHHQPSSTIINQSFQLDESVLANGPWDSGIGCLGS